MSKTKTNKTRYREPLKPMGRDLLESVGFNAVTIDLRHRFFFWAYFEIEICPFFEKNGHITNGHI